MSLRVIAFAVVVAIVSATLADSKNSLPDKLNSGWTETKLADIPAVLMELSKYGTDCIAEKGCCPKNRTYSMFLHLTAVRKDNDTDPETLEDTDAMLVGKMMNDTTLMDEDDVAGMIESLSDESVAAILDPMRCFGSASSFSVYTPTNFTISVFQGAGKEAEIVKQKSLGEEDMKNLSDGLCIPVMDMTLHSAFSEVTLNATTNKTKTLEVLAAIYVETKEDAMAAEPTKTMLYLDRICCTRYPEIFQCFALSCEGVDQAQCDVEQTGINQCPDTTEKKPGEEETTMKTASEKTDAGTSSKASTSKSKASASKSKASTSKSKAITVKAAAAMNEEMKIEAATVASSEAVAVLGQEQNTSEAAPVSHETSEAGKPNETISEAMSLVNEMQDITTRHIMHIIMQRSQICEKLAPEQNIKAYNLHAAFIVYTSEQSIKEHVTKGLDKMMEESNAHSSVARPVVNAVLATEGAGDAEGVAKGTVESVADNAGKIVAQVEKVVDQADAAIEAAAEV